MRIHTPKETGNVLFLILIAVALFAALSYAVTQSGRGGGDAESDKNQLTMAEYTQIVSEMRVAIQRMQLSGTDINDINFCDGPHFGGTQCSITRNDPCTSGTECLFATEGGNVDASRLNKWSYVMYEGPNGDTMAGHGSINLIFSIWGQYQSGVGHDFLTVDECQKIQNAFGESTTLELEQTADNIFADGTSLDGSWDFCMQTTHPNFVYQTFHLLATN